MASFDEMMEMMREGNCGACYSFFINLNNDLVKTKLRRLQWLL